jgi:hypothetical protein
VLHVTNGDAAGDELRRVGAGEVLVVRDVLCLGPLPALDPPALREVRADFLCRWAPRAQVLADLEAVDARLAAADGPVTLWFEDDLHDQVQLAFAATRLPATARPALVDLPRERPADLRALPAVLLGEDDRAALRAAFAALTAPEPAPLPGSEAMAAAGRRLHEELPWTTDGLGRTERAVLAAAAAGARAPHDLYATVAATEERPWAGDATVWSIADGLRAGRRPLLGPGNRPTGHGEAVLAGEADWVALRGGIDRWVGGVHLHGDEPRWRWDPRRGAPVG